MNTLDDLKQEAQDVIRQLAPGDFADAERRFAPVLSRAFPETRLRDEWERLLAQVGPFQEILDCRAVERQENRIVLVSG